MFARIQRSELTLRRGEVRATELTRSNKPVPLLQSVGFQVAFVEQANSLDVVGKRGVGPLLCILFFGCLLRAALALIFIMAGHLSSVGERPLLSVEACVSMSFGC